MYVCIFLVKVTEWPPIGKIAAHSAYEMFSWYKYLIVSLVFSHLGFWSGSLFLIAPFPDLCLLVLFQKRNNKFIEVIASIAYHKAYFYSILIVGYSSYVYLSPVYIQDYLLQLLNDLSFTFICYYCSWCCVVWRP